MYIIVLAGLLIQGVVERYDCMEDLGYGITFVMLPLLLICNLY